MRKLVRYTTFAVLAAVLYLGWVMAGRFLANRKFEKAAQKPVPAAYADYGSAVKILQFYAVPAVVVEGDKALLCYGAANAKKVRIEPAPADEVWPSLNRCLEVAPAKDTRYTFTAEGASGPPVSESIVIRVKPGPHGKLGPSAVVPCRIAGNAAHPTGVPCRSRGGALL